MASESEEIIIAENIKYCVKYILNNISMCTMLKYIINLINELINYFLK